MFQLFNVDFRLRLDGSLKFCAGECRFGGWIGCGIRARRKGFCRRLDASS
jgi:hypothetical protein